MVQEVLLNTSPPDSHITLLGFRLHRAMKDARRLKQYSHPSSFWIYAPSPNSRRPYPRPSYRHPRSGEAWGPGNHASRAIRRVRRLRVARGRSAVRRQPVERRSVTACRKAEATLQDERTYHFPRIRRMSISLRLDIDKARRMGSSATTPAGGWPSFTRVET